jgi:hypothetical protein
VRFTLVNANDFDVTGRATLKSARPIAGASQRRRRRVVTFGSRSFTIPANGRRAVALKLSRRNRAVVKRLRSVRVRLSLSLSDPSGGTRTASRTFALKPPKARRRG